MLANDNLRVEDNAVLACRLADAMLAERPGGRLAFDEYCHGLRDRPSVAEVLFRPPVLGVTVQASPARTCSIRATRVFTSVRGRSSRNWSSATRSTFRQLANAYDFDKDSAGLTALIARHEKEFPEALCLKYWRAELRFLKAEYVAAAAGFRDYREVAGEKDPESYRSNERLLRSLVRANDLPAARRFVQEIGTDKASLGLRGAIEAAAGDAAALELLLTEQMKQSGGLWMFYYDEDFVRLFEAVPFANLKTRFPDPRSKKDR